MKKPLIEIQNIKKCYGEITAISDVNLTIGKGEFMTFLGPSGSGKSTTLYILAGLQEPTSGTISVNGKDILGVPSNKRNIGMVFQRYTLFPHLSVGENVAFPLRVRKMPKAEITERVSQSLKLTRLEGFEDRMPANMSGGQQQRVALARALAYNPDILLMDEPLSALDKKLKEEIQHEIRHIHKQTGVTILYVTHDQEEALRLSDRISVFNKGSIEQIGTGQQLYNAPVSKFVANFIGDSDFLSCTINKANKGSSDISFADGLTIKGIATHTQGKVGDTGQLLLRPERLDLSYSQVKGLVNIPIIIKDFTFLGNTIDVIAHTNWGESLNVRLPYGHACIDTIAQEQKAFVSVHAKDIFVFSN